MLIGVRPPPLLAAGLPDVPVEFSGNGVPTGQVFGGAASEGDASAYSQVWEWGNVRQSKKGPKTTLGINPDGERVWLSIQAPYGYVRVNSGRFADLIERRLLEVDPTSMSLGTQLRSACRAASEDIAVLIRATAPVDTGALKDSIVAVDSDDQSLAAADHWSGGSGHAAMEE